MEIKQMHLTPNAYSRPGTKMDKVKGIVIHYVGNAGSSAEANRNYFENLKSGQKMNNGQYRYASSHYIVGLKGEIIKCVPETEVAYHASSANKDHIGIEVCHPTVDGKFSEVTYQVLIELVADICKRYKLNPLTDVIRHYDVTGKDCPRYYVQHAKAWEQMRNDIKVKMIGQTVGKLKIELNGKVKEIDAINIEGINYVKLRDLVDEKIKVDYDAEKKLPIVMVNS